MSFIRRRPSADLSQAQTTISIPPLASGTAPSYPPPPLYIQTARVSPNVIDFTLRPRTKATLPPPSVELEGCVSHSEWFSRVKKVRALLVKYEWSLLERVGVVVGLLALITLVSRSSWPAAGGGRRQPG